MEGKDGCAVEGGGAAREGWKGSRCGEEEGGAGAVVGVDFGGGHGWESL